MKILVIPDIHGRTFWKEPCKRINDFDKIIFLGDYLDPYPFENINVKDAIENFKDIINFKNNNIHKVELLLGNHDFYYYYKVKGVSRWSKEYHTEIEDLFNINRNIFKIAYETEYTLFTHAGYLKKWEELINIFFNVGYKLEPTAKSLNGLLTTELKFKYSNSGFFYLGMISKDRGGDFSYGSCIWADIYEHQWNTGYIGKYQVFGHTLQLDTTDYYKTYNEANIKDGNEKIIEEQKLLDVNNNLYIIPGFAMLDCRHAFEYIEEKRKFVKI